MDINKNSIKLVGIIFIVFGILSTLSIIYYAIYGKLNINLAALMGIVGFGILKGRESSRRWGRFWCIFFVVISIVMVISAPFGNVTRPRYLSESTARILIFAIGILLGIIFYWCDTKLRGRWGRNNIKSE